MPTVIRKSDSLTVTERRREVRGALGWQVTSGVWSPPTDLFETPVLGTSAETGEGMNQLWKHLLTWTNRP